MSTAFVFRLTRLLRHRRRVEDQRALAVRRAIEEHEAARARQASLERAAGDAHDALNAECAAGLSGAALRLHADGVHDLRGRARTAAVDAAAEAARVEERRTELIEAARQRRVLERLEEIQRAAWQAELTRNDQRITDDIATSRHGRTS